MADMIGGAVVSEVLKQLIEEVKKFKNFKPLSKDLASTMKRLVPLTETIDSLQNKLKLDDGELKGLKETIERAKIVVNKCRDVSVFRRFKLTRDIEQVNKDLEKYCQIDIQLLLYRNQLQSTEAANNNFQNINQKLDKLSAPAPVFRQLGSVYRKLCSVPKLDDKFHTGLDSPLQMLKNKVLDDDDSLYSLLVSAPPGCGKTTLVTQLCHDQDINGKFNHIFYCVVSSKPNFTVIVQNLFQDNGYEPVTFENDPQAANALKDLIEELRESGTILLVLDDVWHGGDDLLKHFRIKLPGYKILVTSRSELRNFDYTYQLQPLNEKDAKALLVHVAPPPCDAPHAVYEELLQKILKRCNGLPLLIEDVGVALKGKPLNYWKGEVESWSGKETILNGGLQRLRPSFTALKPQWGATTSASELGVGARGKTLCKKIDLMNVRAPVSRKLCSVPKLDDKVHIGMAWPLMKLKNKVLDDSLDSLLVSASPGCGKTTLVTQLCLDQGIKDKFHRILYSVVSSRPNFRVIVHHLLEHNGHQAPTFENDTQAANAFKDLIKELRKDGPILLVLDDVWHRADDFLKHFRIKLPGYKILVTSRSQLRNFDYTFPLQPLNEKDAEALLVHVAPRPCDASQADYEEVLQKILKRCNGLPLLIEVVGVALKGKPFRYWEGQVESWSKGETILRNPRSIVLECLEPSFNALEPHLKDCFMDMGSLLEDQKTRASVLIDIWVELYGRGITSRSIAYMKYLHDLASHNLLKLIPLGRNEHEDGFYNELVVTQHDVLRELAIHQSRSEANLETKRLSLVIQGDNYPDDLPLSQRESARFLAISTDDLFSSSWEEMDSFQFPNVEALLLNISSSNYALPRFIATMKKLRAVIIINNVPYSATLTNLSCLSSLKKLKRIRLEKVAITFLDILELQLGSLKKLSLFMCCFGEVSHDKNEIDVSKALSNLQEIDIDYCYDLEKLPSWISEAVLLEKLSITNCHRLYILPENISNLRKLELLRLSSCINLTELPETTARLNNLKFLDISHCLGLRKLPLEIGRLQKLKKISMNKCWKCELPDSVRDLENLVVKCDEKTAGVLWKGLKPKMINLTVQVEETEHNLNLLRLKEHCH